MDDEVNELVKTQNEIIQINCGGKKFSTKTETFLAIKDTLFYKIVVCKKFNLNEELFFDRNPKIFPIILEYLRTKSINYSKLNREQLEDLKIEADYFELNDISEYLAERMKTIEFVRFEFSGQYGYNNQTAGTNKLEDLKDKSLTKGICATTPGWIVIELNNDWEFNEIEIGGYNGNTNLWGATNGANAQVMTSKDKSNWTTVGTLPSTYGAVITKVQLTKSSGKYIKFNHNSYLGIGYLEIIKLK